MNMIQLAYHIFSRYIKGFQINKFVFLLFFFFPIFSLPFFSFFFIFFDFLLYLRMIAKPLLNNIFMKLIPLILAVKKNLFYSMPNQRDINKQTPEAIVMYWMTVHRFQSQTAHNNLHIRFRPVLHVSTAPCNRVKIGFLGLALLLERNSSKM